MIHRNQVDQRSTDRFACRLCVFHSQTGLLQCDARNVVVTSDTSPTIADSCPLGLPLKHQEPSLGSMYLWACLDDRNLVLTREEKGKNQVLCHYPSSILLAVVTVCSRTKVDMLPLDRGLALLALAQTILATLRVASRTVELAQSSGREQVARGVFMEGPLILPMVSVAGTTPNKKRNETSISRWDLTLAFRQCVRLSLNRDDYDVQYEIDSTHLAHGRNLAAMSSPYALDADELDTDGEPPRGTPTTAIVERFKGVLATKSGSALPVLALKKYEDDEDAVQRRRRGLDPMESDFYLTLSTDCVIRRHAHAASGIPPRVARVTSYAPDCFAELRSLYGVGEADFRRSILESGPYVSFQSNSKGAARTGGFFFFSRDGAYMVKTIKKDEVDALLDMLPRYYRFMRRNGRRSLLTRFCGMYDVSFRDSNGDIDSSHTFVIMNSVFPPEGSRIITERFDLKGSTLGREVSIDERETMGRNAVLKDLDLAREVQLLQSLQQRGGKIIPEYGINIGSNAKAAFMAQVRRDVQFLVDCECIDYSLLVGVAKVSQGMSELDQHILNQAQERLQQPHSREPNMLLSVVSGLLLPIRILLAPNSFPNTSASATLRPGQCAVDGGPLSQILGHRLGSRAIYYFGLIDFLQPYNAKKAIEYRLKSIVYDQGAFSCVPPRAYADRFLEFLDRHIV
jgi:Phosphatidylinositol-4-phosphate 5-Kinase